MSTEVVVTIAFLALAIWLVICYAIGASEQLNSDQGDDHMSPHEMDKVWEEYH